METVVRIALIYVFILAGLRILGKREFGQLSPLELVTLMLIPEIVSQALVKEDFSMTNALVGVSTLFVLVFFTSVLIQKSDRFGEILSGSPVVLVHHGDLVTSAMNKERVSPGELYSEMHKAGIESLKDVKWGILEPDGKISFIGYSPELSRKPPESRHVA